MRARAGQKLSAPRGRTLVVAAAIVVGAILLLATGGGSSVDAKPPPVPATPPPSAAPPRSIEWPVAWCKLKPHTDPAVVAVASTSPWGYDAATDRGHQEPFVNGDGLRLCADLAVNETDHRLWPLDPRTGSSGGADSDAAATAAAGAAAVAAVAAGRTVTVFLTASDTPHVLAFVRNVTAAHTTARFTLVAHNSDFAYPHRADAAASAAADALAAMPAVAAVYAQNLALPRDATGAAKHFPLPIGVENRYNPYGKSWHTYMRHACRASRRRPTGQRKKLLLVSIARVHTASADRTALLRAAKALAAAAPDLVTIATYKTLEEYLSAVSEHVFVAAPRGNGWDTHRAYDGWMMGAFVVTKRGPLDSLYGRLPSLLLGDWGELTLPALTAARERLLAGLAAGTLDVAPELLTARHWRTALFPGNVGRSPLCPGP